MKLLRYGPVGHEKPGLLDNDDSIRDLSSVVVDITGTVLSPGKLAELSAIDPAGLPKVEKPTRIGACVGNTGKFVCIGLNYADHAAESGAAAPEEPVLFMKATSSICGPNDDIIIPPAATMVDWEAELGVVIGTEAKFVGESDAMNYVAGYCAVNDLSERAFQIKRGGQWTKGKSADGFGPIGPWLVTRDEIADPQNLDLWLEVDGRRYQEGSTRNMLFGVASIVSYVSQFMSLQPGDIISTGTPAGVGMGQKPDPVYLQPGQTVRLGIAGLGEQMQEVMPWVG